MPASAARDLSWRCSVSGTLRIWIIAVMRETWAHVPHMSNEEVRMNRFVVVSGCSGGGKSTLLAELGRRGHDVVEEPGRRIVKKELESGGRALPWVDGPAFARRAVAMALADRAAAEARPGWVFF